MSFGRIVRAVDVLITNRGPASASKDRYGTPVPDVADPVALRGWLEETPGIEVQAGRDTVISNWTLVLPPDAVIDARDTVSVDGVLYRVMTSPTSAPTARGAHHLSVHLQEIAG